MHTVFHTGSLDRTNLPCLKEDNAARLRIEHLKQDLRSPLDEAGTPNLGGSHEETRPLPLVPGPPDEASLPTGIAEPGGAGREHQISMPSGEGEGAPWEEDRRRRGSQPQSHGSTE